jgi:hypothetical protein
MALKHRQAQNPGYWEKWAEARGARYFAVREPYETAESCASCVSSEPRLQEAFVLGWRKAAQAK